MEQHGSEATDERARGGAGGGTSGSPDEERRAHPSRRQSRRGVLQGMAGMGVGVGTATPGKVIEGVEQLLAETDPETLDADPRDPHTVATFEAIVDAVIPNTEDDPLTDKVTGEELPELHQYGGLEIDLHLIGIEFINDFISPPAAVPKVASTGETAPLSEAVAAVLDGAASELIARGGNADEPQPGRFGPAGGPFTSLSRTDRFRAMKGLKDTNGEYGGFVVALAVAFPAIVYYSEIEGYDGFLDIPPSEREFDPAAHNDNDVVDNVLGWAQTGYPGETDGHAVLLGYELDEAYRKTEYGKRDEDGIPGTGEPSVGGSESSSGQRPEDPGGESRNPGGTDEEPDATPGGRTGGTDGHDDGDDGILGTGVTIDTPFSGGAFR